MNPPVVFILAVLIYLTKGLYLGKFIGPFRRRFGEITGYWIAMSIFTVVFAVFITLLYPKLYFIHWSFPADYFLIFLSLSILTVVPAILELKKLAGSEANYNEEFELSKNMSFGQAAFLQIISAALPEELVFRYIFLGLLSLWNPFAGLLALSLFFGLAHKFAHPERSWKVLLSNTLAGFVLGLAYLYTKSLLVVMAIHWLDNMIFWAYIKYDRARKAIGVAVALSLLSPVVLWDQTARFIEYLRDIFSLSGLLWGIVLGFAMLGVVYTGIKALRGRSGR
ncbi:CPBP family intramembrane glutamic endopeptidase [Thermococcus sp. 18S1]|uniref:CPBP family intramembrane glutamic endopeptidase n=1 Tax=Thermococcus sp. 18S1 TaxID=1638210 RepID=UPI001F0F811A|nr:type II CAAX endopeptidase family protein [Thermococcus sp. 18S1]